LFFIGCGYKPSSIYQNKILGNEIKPVISIDIENPRESIFLKDAVNDAIYTLFGKNVCYQNCDATMYVKTSFANLTPLDYDENGYPILYRSRVTLRVTLIDKNGKKRRYSVSGNYDFKITSDSVLNDQIKFEAYKQASVNALNKLIAQITKDGVKYDN